MKLDHLAVLNAERAARRAVALVTDLAGGTQRLVRAVELGSDPAGALIEERMRAGKSGNVEHDGKSLFINVQVPGPRLVIIGAVHVSQSLAVMAKLVDFDVTIIDPRTAFATAERFPDVCVLAQWPDEALASIGLDAYTAVAALTHDPKIDDPALSAALRADCFYIGALGSRRTHAGRLERLGKAGFSADDVARIHAPIGLDIGAVSPAEIAVSIIGEIVAALRRKPLRNVAKNAA